MSRASIRIILAELTAVLNHARVDGLITINPAGRLGKLYKQAPVLHEEIQPLMAEEVRLFLSAAALFLTAAVLPAAKRDALARRVERAERLTGLSSLMLAALLVYWLARLLYAPHDFTRLMHG